MSTDGAMMPMIETNLETVRNPTNLFVGGCQFAVALYKRCPIWSNDKLMAKQDRVKVISTKELLAILGMQ